MVKTWQCADDGKQSKYTEKGEAALPTVTTEAIFLTRVIKAKEGRHVGIIYLPEAFLHACNDEGVMLMHDRLAELMLITTPQTYRKYTTIEKGRKCYM